MILFSLLAGVALSGVAEAKAGDAQGDNDKAGTGTRWAIVAFSANFMREDPGYEAELGNQALMGTVVQTLDTTSYWVRIKSPEPYTAWVNEMGLVPVTEKELEDYLEAPKYICVASSSRVYSEPSYDSRIVSDLVQGDIVRILYKNGGRHEGRTEGRAVTGKKFAGVLLPSGKTGYVPAKDISVFREWARARAAKLTGNERAYREDLVSSARDFLGVPYMWGGTSTKNVDCSGLTRGVYFANGVLLPRNASQQARAGEHVEIFRADGSVTWENLLPGDLLFWGRAATETGPERITHVGMYVGDGYYIHSSQVVRQSSLDPGSEEYDGRKPVRARRVVGTVDKPGSGIVSVISSPFYFRVN